MIAQEQNRNAAANTFKGSAEISPQGETFETASFTADIRSSFDLLENTTKESRNRNQREQKELLRLIEFIARVFSRNYSLEVIPSPQGQWACGIDPKFLREVEAYITAKTASIDSLPEGALRPKIILYDPEDIKKADEDQILGVLRHEVGHANNTDYKLFFKGQRLAFDQGYLPTSWAWIFNALEDPWVNNIEINGSEVVRQKMQRLYSVHMPEIVEKINTQPVTHQLGLNINYYWVTGKNIPSITNKEVLETFERIKPYVDKYFVGKTAKDNFELLRDHIWPEYRKLEKKAVQDEALKEFARSATGNDLGKEKSPSMEEKPQNGLWQRIKDFLGFGREKGDEGNSDEKFSEAVSQGVEGSLRKKLDRELRKQSKKSKENDKQENHDTQSKGIPADIDLDQIPASLRKELENAMSALTPEQKNELEKQAIETLDSKNAEALERESIHTLEARKDPDSGKRIVSFRDPPENKALERQRIKIGDLLREMQKIEQVEQQQATVKEMLEQQAILVKQQREDSLRGMREAGFEEDEKLLYDKFRDLEGSMEDRVREFTRILERYLPKKETFVFDGEHYSGSKIDRRALARRYATGDFRIYKRPEIIESHEPRIFVKLLIDNSGSMRGEKMEESLKTAVFWGKVLRRFGIPFSIDLFGAKVQEIMSFDDDYNDPKRRIKPNLLMKAQADEGCTNIGEPLSRTKDELSRVKRRFKDYHGAVFLISDSGANTGLVKEGLKALVGELQKDNTVMNFILSGAQHEIAEAKYYFGEGGVVAPKTFKELPEEAFSVLRLTLERILRLYQPRR